MSNTKYLTNDKLIYLPDLIHNPIKEIDGHPTYGADYEGNIYHTVNDHLKLIRPFSKGNYMAVKLDNETCSVAQIIARLYITNIDPSRYKVFHIDGQIINNKASNLAWVTPSEVDMLTYMEIEQRIDYLKNRDQREVDIAISME